MSTKKNIWNLASQGKEMIKKRRENLSMMISNDFLFFYDFYDDCSTRRHLNAEKCENKIIPLF